MSNNNDSCRATRTGPRSGGRNDNRDEMLVICCTSYFRENNAIVSHFHRPTTAS